MKIELSDDKILEMACAIKELERIKQCWCPQEIVLPLHYQEHGEKIICTDNPSGKGIKFNFTRNSRQIAYDIFKPLLDSGLEKYREEIRKIADGNGQGEAQ